MWAGLQIQLHINFWLIPNEYRESMNECAADNGKLHMFNELFNKLAARWVGKYSGCLDEARLMREREFGKCQLNGWQFTCKFHRKGGSFGCRNNLRQMLDIRGDHKICRNIGRIHSLDLKTWAGNSGFKMCVTYFQAFTRVIILISCMR